MQRKHLGIVLSLAVALVGGPSTMASAESLVPRAAVEISMATAKPIKQSIQNLNLRSKASTTSASLLVIPINTKLAILAVSGKWNQVTYESKTGWVSGDFLKSFPVSSVKVYGYAKAFTAVRAKPASSSASVLLMQRQTKVQVLGTSGSWSRVSVSGKTGWVPSSGLSKSVPAAIYRWVNGKQPVLKSASTSGATLVTLSSNTRVSWLRTSGSWQQVRTSAGIGWIQTQKLSNVVIKPQVKVYGYAKAFTAVRAKPASSSASVLLMQRQTKVQVLGTSGSWSRVSVSGKTGWVPSSGLSKSVPAAIYRWVNGKQPVLKSASTSGATLVTLSSNTRVSWLRTSGSWQQVRTSAGIGWIQTQKLSNVVIKPQVKVYGYAKAFTAVRAKPASSSASVLLMQRQTKVQVLGTSGSWSRVSVSGKTGWVPSSGLSKSVPAAIYRWVNGKQPVLKSASTSGATLVTLSSNTRVSWLRTSGSWQQVRTSAGIGWIQTQKLSTKPVANTPPKPAPVTYSSPRWTTDFLNLRTHPTTSSASLGVIPRGEKVLYGRSSGGWSNVKTSKGTGWVSSIYLSSAAPKPPVVKPTPPLIEQPSFTAPRWTTTNLNVRSGPGTSNTSIGVIPRGEKVLYARSSGGWANVKTSKGIGWVSELYLSTVAPKPAVEVQYRWATANVNLRTGGSSIHPVMGVVPAGQKVTYLRSSNGWANVVSSVGTGWMSEEFLAKTESVGLQPDTIAVNAAVKARFGSYVYGYGGVRAGSVGHSSGRATDLMIKDYKSAQGISNGNEVARFLITNREALGIDYLIWQDKIWLGPSLGWQEYSKSGKYGTQFTNNWNDTTRHMDHIHAETEGDSGTGAPLID
ncbi:SH3 domain-containing protein [Paeniglutamicibacter terrestris]|uniref:SH3 domain-containing protein n=1 Tax=Paeniglutamicibacter terrestris TaxID=2723403 RepID=A0ABX1G3H8_9MICC|nr:SH3 domain-containing protein [Paeniglutamicibacter terrestris]NKG20584.1 SH3 domain-containing protein [Paeniglutamicibacter terrestris]